MLKQLCKSHTENHVCNGVWMECSILFIAKCPWFREQSVQIYSIIRSEQKVFKEKIFNRLHMVQPLLTS